MSDSSDDSVTCYTIGSEYISSTNQFFPCTSANSTTHASCCYHGDYCMEGGVCHYTHDKASGSGYYLAGCTDPTYADESCPKQCTGQWGTDIVYNFNTNLWACCDNNEWNNGTDCTKASDLTFQDPAPSSLSTVTQLNVAVPTTDLHTVRRARARARAQPQPTRPQPPQPPPQAPPPPSPGLSTGAQAGIGVGVGVGALILLGIGALLFLRRRRRTRAAGGYGAPGPNNEDQDQDQDRDQQHGPAKEYRPTTAPERAKQYAPGYDHAARPVYHELPQDQEFVELPAERRVGELEGPMRGEKPV
ncbi:hypothetical protein H2203_008248 [Taxawa tesnikishii (nom. ined.)]|nr:hypothetical protein H2203_008248 [Dothideales sp. JES 119]